MLEIENLSVGLGAKIVLQKVSLQVAPGELCTVIGPNGSGKSTLLRAIAGVLPLQNGVLRFQNAPLPPPPARAKIVAMLPQNVVVESDLSVEENALLGRTPHLPPFGAPSKSDEETVDWAIESVAPDLRGRLLSTLSGGQRQRAALARPLATNAPILLLDEPIAALDLRFQHEILGLVKRLTREKMLATICVLHGINLASLVADSMLLLNSSGEVVAFGTPESVMTTENLSRVYDLPLQIAPHPVSGRPQAQSLWDFS